MSSTEYEFDIFISYAHEDSAWVKEHLIEPFKGCRTADGRAIRVFLDVESIRIAANFAEIMTEAVHKSRVFLAVYSKNYFPSKYCHLELLKGFERDMFGQHGFFLPLAIEPDIEQLVPKAYSHLNWHDATQTGWFEKLLEHLGYRHYGRLCTLRFKNFTFQTVTDGAPLPEIQLSIEADGATVDEAEVIRLISENGTLRGTTSKKSVHGVAAFTDLFFDSPLETTRLVATADACSAAFSEPFAVVPAPAIVTPKCDPAIHAQGEVHFFGDPEVVGVGGRGECRVYDLAGGLRGVAPIPHKWRFAKRRGGGLVFCGWDGEIVWVGPKAEREEWKVTGGELFNVVGDIASHVASGPSALLAGMWSGDVLSLRPGGEARLEFRHSGGVQAMEARDQNVFLADLEGFLCVYFAGALSDRVHRLPDPGR